MSAVRYRDLYVRRVRERFRRRKLVPPLVAVITTEDDGNPSGMTVLVAEQFALWMNCFLEPIKFPDDWMQVESLPLLSDLFGEIRGLYPDLAAVPDGMTSSAVIRGSLRCTHTVELPDLETVHDFLLQRLARRGSLKILNLVNTGPYPQADYVFERRDRPKRRLTLRLGP